jgi:hypothetical protein
MTKQEWNLLIVQREWLWCCKGKWNQVYQPIKETLGSCSLGSQVTFIHRHFREDSRTFPHLLQYQQKIYFFPETMSSQAMLLMQWYP